MCVNKNIFTHRCQIQFPRGCGPDNSHEAGDEVHELCLGHGLDELGGGDDQRGLDQVLLGHHRPVHGALLGRGRLGRGRHWDVGERGRVFRAIGVDNLEN